MGTSTATFLEISAGSESMWMNVASGAKVCRLPVTRSSKRTPDRDDEVGLADGVVGVLGAVHAEHAHGQVVVFGEAALADERGGHGDVAVDGQLAQLVGRARR